MRRARADVVEGNEGGLPRPHPRPADRAVADAADRKRVLTRSHPPADTEVRHDSGFAASLSAHDVSRDSGAPVPASNGSPAHGSGGSSRGVPSDHGTPEEARRPPRHTGYSLTVGPGSVAPPMRAAARGGGGTHTLTAPSTTDARKHTLSIAYEDASAEAVVKPEAVEMVVTTEEAEAEA